MRNDGVHAAREPFSLAGCLLDIVLLLVNSVGIVGALTEILDLPWREGGIGNALPGLEPALFWGVLVFFCAAAVLVRSGASGKRVLVRAAAGGILYLFLGAVFRKMLSGGISLALENTMGNLNERYQFHIAWAINRVQESAGWDTGMRTFAMTCGVLYLLFPLELMAGVFGRYDRGFCLIMGNALWFTLACMCDRFPGYFFLAFCVSGAVATLAAKGFRHRPGAGAAVAACSAAIALLTMGAVFRFFLPVLDRQHEEILERRGEFYRLVNEEWIPKLKSILPRGGFGQGADVSGQLGRSGLFAYTAEGVYRVTVNRKPQGTIYLKGFVGGGYDGKEWLAPPDGELEDYYRGHGLALPENLGEFANISYEAAKGLQHGAEPEYIQIEELGGKGSYSVYPYGALLTEELQVHGDGSVARVGREYGFQYYYLSGFGGRNVLPAGLAETERQYRGYVYGHFLEYPKEELPRLAACLEAQGIRRDNVYACTLDLIQFLDRQAEYNLDAGNNPPGTDFVEYFLFESREGYCMHFASAAVLALRYFGIPARYVAGYAVSPSDFAAGKEGGYTAVVTGRQAHAWAEVYLDTIGWVPVEMTPGAAAFPEDNRMEQLGQLGQLAGQGLMLSDNEELWRQDKTAWQNGTPEGRQGQEAPPEGGQEQAGIREGEPPREEAGQKEDAAGSRQDIPGGKQQAGPEGDGRVPFTHGPGFRICMAILAAAMLAGAALCLEKWDRCRRREQFSRAGRRERIFLLYRNFRAIFRLAGYRRGLPVDGEEFRQVLLYSFQVSHEEYGNFCRILEKNSFAKEEPSEEEFQKVRSLCDRLAGEAYRCAAFYKKPLIRRLQDRV